MQQARNWVFQCGHCAGNLWIKNAAIVRDHLCPACADNTIDPEMPLTEELVVSELGWCSCGNPEAVDEMMLAYLESLTAEHFPKPLPEGMSEDAVMLLAYIADDLGWTEHGGSIGGSWLSDDGKTAMGNLRATMVDSAASDASDDSGDG